MSELAHIAEDLRPLAVEIDSVTLDPENVRDHSARSVEAIQASYARFGQQKPIVADPDGRIISGNGQLMAARALGWTHIAVQNSTLTGEDAEAFALADNRTNELSAFDPAKLREKLAGMSPANAMAAGFNEAELLTALGQMTIPGAESATFDQVDGSGNDSDPDAPLDTSPQMSDGVEYRVVVSCDGEAAQTALSARLEEEGYSCQLLMS